MTLKRKKHVQISCFEVQGTNNIYVANKAVNKLLSKKRCGLKEARYKIDGKTIVIKPIIST